MSVKDVKEYYDKITKDYNEMIVTLKEMEELSAQNIINPDKVEEIRKMVEPLKINFERISWIMFLLNKPNKKKKQERYYKQNKKYLEFKDVEIKENQEVNNKINEYKI